MDTFYENGGGALSKHTAFLMVRAFTSTYLPQAISHTVDFASPSGLPNASKLFKVLSCVDPDEKQLHS